MNVSIIGLGKLGLCMAACIASKGHRVIGVDIDEQKLGLINAGRSPMNETGLGELLATTRDKLTATSDYDKAIRESEATFIVVATPSEADGGYSNAQLEAAARKIGAALRGKSEYHVVAVTSTVMPSTTDSIVKPILEETSGKKCGDGLGLAYNPEFIALGSVIRDFMNPDFVLVGETESRAGDYLADFYRRVCDNNPPMARMSPINAEITKLALNCYVTTKITFANSLAQVCESASGANVDVITRALGMDSRIGSKYLKGGLGYGGPCFPRDNRAFATFAHRVGESGKLAETVDEVNFDQAARIVALVKQRLHRGAGVAILGLAYKPNTDIVDDSQPVEIARQLAAWGARVSVYDPMALADTRRFLGDQVRYAESARDCLQGAAACVMATPWDEFKKLSVADFKRAMAGSTVIDCWRTLRENSWDGMDYIPLGLGRSG